MGGTETLLLRMMAYYRSIKCRVILLTLTPIHESIIRDAVKVDFEHYIYAKKKFYSLDIELSFNNVEKPIVITQYMPEFLRSFLLLRKSIYGVEFRHLLYIVHPGSTLYRPKFLNSFARIMILTLLKKKVLVFMDETCAENCRKTYRLAKSIELSIFRLPMFIRDDFENFRPRNKIFNILTISRFEFPFKGYILGLIRSFHKLLEKYSDLSLTIIGHGAGKSEVDELIATLPSSTSSKITLLDYVPYHEITDHIIKCDTFVGMGTTVLDAANINKIVVSAVAYQRQNYASGFFHDNYRLIGEVYNDSVKFQEFQNLIEDVINLNDDQFIHYSKMTKSLLREFYNIESIANELLQHTNGYFSTLEQALIGSLAKAYILRVGVADYIKKRWM
jgi:hypothetical protein